MDETQFEASSYRAANWQYLDATEKRSGKTRTGVYVHPLEEGFQDILVHGEKVRSKPNKRRRAVSSMPMSRLDSLVQLWQRLSGEISETAAEFE